LTIGAGAVAESDRLRWERFFAIYYLPLRRESARARLAIFLGPFPLALLGEELLKALPSAAAALPNPPPTLPLPVANAVAAGVRLILVGPVALRRRLPRDVFNGALLNNAIASLLYGFITSLCYAWEHTSAFSLGGCTNDP
jgi:hypothetical protein